MFTNIPHHAKIYFECYFRTLTGAIYRMPACSRFYIIINNFREDTGNPCQEK